MADLREKRVELILQQLEELPTLPSVALRVLEATTDEGSSAPEVGRIISGDAALTTRILKLLHRSDNGVRGEITGIERAVVLLGFETVRNAVLAITVFETFNAVAPQQSTVFNRNDFWKHCIAVACCAELLVDTSAANGRASSDLRSAAFLCGLLHDLGKIALDASLPKSFSRVVEAADLLRGNIADVERRVIGLDHMVVGKRLAERWRLPQAVRECAWLHGQLPSTLPGAVQQPRLVNLVTLADELVRSQHLGYSGNYGAFLPRPQLLEAAGVTAEHVKTVLARLVDEIEPRAAAMGLGQASSSELYQKALEQANAELGRVSGQVEAKNRKLAVRARFFDAMSGFSGELNADAEVNDVLRAIAQTAVGSLGVASAVAFSLAPGHRYAETLICNETGEVTETSLIDLPTDAAEGSDAKTSARLTPGGRPSKPAAGDGPVMAVGEELQWISAAVSPRLPHDRRFWICLTADGQCIGGVLWGAVAGEAQRLGSQVHELTAISGGWSLALRTAQIREEARSLAEQLAEANRQLLSAQGQILRTRMMVSVGEMAAGAAHEMNNPLAVISGRSQLLASQLTEPKFKAAAHLIHEQSHRLSAIITELMDYARPEAPALEEAEIADVLERALHEAKMQNDPADRSIELTIGDAPAAWLDGRQVSAAITEVLVNAIHATDAKTGHIAIHADFDPFSNRLVVTINDDGCGMDEETTKHAFDPFFSNQPAGRRRGMGLAKAMRWIEASGGSIRLESQVGTGTRSVILLPAVPPSPTIKPLAGRRAENF